MDNTLMKTFVSQKFGSIRAIECNDEPWFVGKDVAIALGYKDTKNALKSHVSSEDKRGWQITTPFGIQTMTIINESGLYALIFGSKLEAAKEFKHWVTKEVLPTIHKYGIYATDDLLVKILQDPNQMLRVVDQLIDAKIEARRLSDKVEVDRPKVEYFDTFVNPEDCTNIRNTAKQLGLPERKFVQYLLSHGYLYRTKSGRLMPYAQYHKAGYFALRDFHKQHSTETGQYTMITSKGKSYFLENKEKILDEIEGESS